MFRFPLFILLVLLLACSEGSKKESIPSKDNSKQTVTTPFDKELKLKARFNSFDTTIEVLFWDTTDSISEIQKKNYEGFISKQDIFVPEILKKIFEFYKRSYKDYRNGWKMGGDITEVELEKNIPKPTTPENLKHFIVPAFVHIQNKKHCKEGTFGIEFDCTWDIEYGLGVKIENWKVVEVGVAETSYFFNGDDK